MQHHILQDQQANWSTDPFRPRHAVYWGALIWTVYFAYIVLIITKL